MLKCRIVIHTYPSIDPQDFNDFAKTLAKLPNIEFVQDVKLSTVTRKGIAIRSLAHQSDFLRAEILAKYGGIYMDSDAYTLKDFRHLLTSGYRNVIGQQAGGSIGNGFSIATKHSRFFQLFADLMHEFYDGTWNAHSVKLITKLYNARSSIENEVFLLDSSALYPFSWTPEELKALYVEGEAARDFSDSYSLHGYTSAFHFGEANDVLRVFKSIDVEYVLRQKSNFARAVYPAVKHALDHGYLSTITTPKVYTNARFDNIYVVNLPNRFEKWKMTQDEIGTSTIFQTKSIHRMIGVNGKTQDLLTLYTDGKLSQRAYKSVLETNPIGGTHMTAGAIGCALSHIQLWKLCIEQQKPLLILEDDVRLAKDDFDAKLAQALNDLPDDFGMLYFNDLAKTEQSRAKQHDYKGSSLYKLSGEFWGTYVYLISPKAAEILYKNVFPLSYQIDSMIIDIALKHNIPVYRTKEELTWSDNSNNRKSDVQVYQSDISTLSIDPQFKRYLHILDFHGILSAPHSWMELMKLDNNQAIKIWTRENLVAEFGDVSNVLRLQCNILQRYGGILLSQVEFWNSIAHRQEPNKIRETIRSILLGVNGFVAFEKGASEMYYPLMALKTSSSISQMCLERLETSATFHTTLLKTMKRVPEKDSEVLFPVNVLLDAQDSGTALD